MRMVALKVVAAAAAFTLTLGTGVALAQPPQVGDLSGTVTTASGPLQGVEVLARNADSTAPVVAPATTDASGNYTFTGIPAGRYLIAFVAHGYATANPGFDSTSVTAGGSTTGVDMQLQPGSSISGKITNAANQPMANVQVLALNESAFRALLGLTLLDGSGASILIALYEALIPASITNLTMPSPGFTTTAADGTFTVDGLLPGTYSVAASTPGMAPPPEQTVTIAAAGGNPTVNMSFPSGATLQGRVLDFNGQPLVGVDVTASTATTVVSLLGGTPTSTTDATGAYKITGLSKGAYVLSTNKDGLLTFDNKVAHIFAPSDDVTTNFTAPGAGTVTGKVTDDNNNPVPGASLLLFGLNGFAQATTGADGTYTFSGLPNDSYDISINTSAFLPAADLTANVTDTTQNVTGNFALTRGATMSGTVVDPQNHPVFGAVVLVRPDGSSGSGYHTDTTLPDGTFSIGGLDTGSYLVTVEVPGFASPAVVHEAVATHADALTNVNLTLLPVSDANAPGKPQLQVQGGPRAIALAVTAPGSDGGNPITRYNVVVQPGNHKCALYLANACLVNKLLDGTLYSVRVTASNEVGTGPAGVSQSWTDAAPAVTNVKAKPGKAGQAYVSFKAPSTPNGIVDYKFEYKVKSSWKVFAHAKSKSTTILVKGLAAKKTFTGRITAVLKSGRAQTSKPFSFKTG